MKYTCFEVKALGPRCVCVCVCVCVGKKLELLNSDSDIVQKDSRFHRKHLLGREISHDFVVHVAS